MESSPPDTDQPMNEWDQLSQQAEGRTARRAAAFLWIIGGVEVVGSLLLILGFTATALLSPEQLQQSARQQGYDSTMTGELLQVQKMMLPMIGMVIVLGLIPAVAYIVLAFRVRRQNFTSMGTVQVMLLTQTIVIGILFASTVFSAVQAGNPAALTLFVLILGTPLAVSIYTIKLLLQARYELLHHTPVPNHASAHESQQEDDPWP